MVGRRGVRWIWLLAVLVLGQAAEGQVRTFVLGDSPHTWESGGNGRDPEFMVGKGRRARVDTNNVLEGAVEFDHKKGWLSARFFDPEENIASMVLKEGEIDVPNVFTRYGKVVENQLRGTVNGDHDVAYERKPTPFEPVVPTYGIWIVLDFVRQVGVHRVRFYPRNTVVANSRKPFQNDYLRAYEVWVNDRLTSRAEGAPDRLVARVMENEEPVADVPVEPQYVRLLKLRSLAEAPFEIDEIEVYGTGYLGGATYLSDLIDLGGRATVGRVRWREEVVGEAPFSRLVVRVRTGRDDTPILYRRFLRNEDMEIVGWEEIGAEEYWAMDEHTRPTLLEDDENWSQWKAAPREGLVTAPGPRQFIQFQVQFEGRIFDARQLDALEFDYLRPPLADTLRAEVFPRLAAAEKPATFHYAVLMKANGAVYGFDQLEVDSNALVENIRNVRVDGEPVTFEVLSNDKSGFRLGLPLIRRDGAVLEFTFDLPIFRFGTTFSSRAYNSRFPQVPQQPEPGQVVDFGPDDVGVLSGLSVEIPKPQIGRLVGEIVLDSGVLTPNGDGVNDQFGIFFNVLQLLEPTPVVLEVFDLAGRRIVTVFDEERPIGPARYSWDGRLSDGHLILPGNYIWVLRIEADAFEERHSGVLCVAY
jgi:hypothetical protein